MTAAAPSFREYAHIPLLMTAFRVSLQESLPAGVPALWHENDNEPVRAA